MNELQALAGGIETSDCIVSWSDSTGNNVGEGFPSWLQARTQHHSPTQTDALTPKQSKCCLSAEGAWMPWPAIIPLKPTLMTALASTMMIAVCVVVTTALAAVALMRMQRTTTRQQRLKMGLACTTKKLSTHWLNHWNAPLVRILTVQGTSLLMGTSELMTSFRCYRSTTHLVRNKPTAKKTQNETLLHTSLGCFLLDCCWAI